MVQRMKQIKHNILSDFPYPISRNVVRALQSRGGMTAGRGLYKFFERKVSFKKEVEVKKQ